MDLSSLRDWRTLPGRSDVSGIGTYTTDTTLPASWTAHDRGVRLDLGTFDGSVQVYVNGERVTADTDPEAPIDITSFLQPGVNHIRIELATTLFNAAVANHSSRIAKEYEEGPQPYGLESDVHLLPYARGSLRLPGPIVGGDEPRLGAEPRRPS